MNREKFLSSIYLIIKNKEEKILLQKKMVGTTRILSSWFLPFWFSVQFAWLLRCHQGAFDSTLPNLSGLVP